MKKLIAFSSCILVAIILFTVQLNISSCTKDSSTVTIKTDTLITYAIQGLWVGTASNSSTPNPYFFSFTVFPDGTVSYKSTVNSYTYFATGTWTLTGTTFSFSVALINNPGGVQETQTGTATYNNASGTLTDGTVSSSNGTNATWAMNKVN